MPVIKIILFAITCIGVIGGSLWEANDKEEVHRKKTLIIKRIGFLAMIFFFVLEILYSD